MDTVGSLAIGYATGGNAGAFTGANADWNNRQLHSSEYKLAEQYADIVASRLNISKEEALGQIIRHMQRTVDYATAKADNFRTDDAIISILGANNLPKQDQHYTNPNYNKQYIQNYVRDFNLANKYNYFMPSVFTFIPICGTSFPTYPVKNPIIFKCLKVKRLNFFLTIKNII